MDIHCKKVTTINEFIDAIRLRVDVFIREQSFQPGWEPDEDDKLSEHFIAIVDNRIVAAGRLRSSDPTELKLERMVTEKNFRGNGVGRALLNYMLEHASSSKPNRIWLRSQVRSQGFYEKCGFKSCTDSFDMWGVPHIDMNFIGG